MESKKIFSTISNDLASIYAEENNVNLQGFDGMKTYNYKCSLKSGFLFMSNEQYSHPYDKILIYTPYYFFRVIPDSPSIEFFPMINHYVVKFIILFQNYKVTWVWFHLLLKSFDLIKSFEFEKYPPFRFKSIVKGIRPESLECSMIPMKNKIQFEIQDKNDPILHTFSYSSLTMMSIDVLTFSHESSSDLDPFTSFYIISNKNDPSLTVKMENEHDLLFSFIYLYSVIKNIKTHNQKSGPRYIQALKIPSQEAVPLKFYDDSQHIVFQTIRKPFILSTSKYIIEVNQNSEFNINKNIPTTVSTSLEISNLLLNNKTITSQMECFQDDNDNISIDNIDSSDTIPDESDQTKEVQCLHETERQKLLRMAEISKNGSSLIHHLGSFVNNYDIRKNQLKFTEIKAIPKSLHPKIIKNCHILNLSPYIDDSLHFGDCTLKILNEKINNINSTTDDLVNIGNYNDLFQLFTDIISNYSKNTYFTILADYYDSIIEIKNCIPHIESFQYQQMYCFIINLFQAKILNIFLLSLIDNKEIREKLYFPSSLMFSEEFIIQLYRAIKSIKFHLNSMFYKHAIKHWSDAEQSHVNYEPKYHQILWTSLSMDTEEKCMKYGRESLNILVHQIIDFFSDGFIPPKSAVLPQLRHCWYAFYLSSSVNIETPEMLVFRKLLDDVAMSETDDPNILLYNFLLMGIKCGLGYFFIMYVISYTNKSHLYMETSCARNNSMAIQIADAVCRISNIVSLIKDDEIIEYYQSK
ncbi:hypothetical protein TRFO_08848 [Tritrichomonas foetus]|uniref:Uncharacterized protein n=1 Tax=Tritrichomonas foetus TaxID=1144522 RepID=A0A1J4JIZ3_9EUKA|nr:hypothetical protein TRFO_08848 [Tritrichomonas foetus]|eukprot:OHS98561.1 hypothetical protein TRFO_08848 [Tritrichomonas foetus]